MREHDDPLNTARGILLGLILGAGLWVLIILAAYGLWSAFHAA